MALVFHDLAVGAQACIKVKNNSVEDGFDTSTSGLWAQHTSAVPLCCKPPQIGLEPTGGQCLIHSATGAVVE